MLLLRATTVALLVTCAFVSLTLAAEDPVFVQDVDSNQVLPENDVVKGRVNEAPVWEDKPLPSTAVPVTAPVSEPGLSTSAKDEPTASTPAPPQSSSALSRFLSDIIQIPIAMFRIASGFLGTTFSGESSTPSSDA